MRKPAALARLPHVHTGAPLGFAVVAAVLLGSGAVTAGVVTFDFATDLSGWTHGTDAIWVAGDLEGCPNSGHVLLFSDVPGGVVISRCAELEPSAVVTVEALYQEDVSDSELAAVFFGSAGCSDYLDLRAADAESGAGTLRIDFTAAAMVRSVLIELHVFSDAGEAPSGNFDRVRLAPGNLVHSDDFEIGSTCRWLVVTS